MPERPDLEYVVPILHRSLAGQTITGVTVRKPVVLRLDLPGDPASLLVGQRISAVRRRAHFVVFDVDGGEVALDLIVSPMLAGRFWIGPPGQRVRADTGVQFSLSGGEELRYRDDVQMGKVYVIAKGAWSRVPGLEHVGVDVLSRAFTKAAFRKIARTRRDQVKVFLMDKQALDAFGNAYADEVLWEAKLHPKTFVRKLPDEQLDALHDAIVKVQRDAKKTIARRKPALDEKLRDFLHVRGRAGQPCDRCGTKLRSAGVRGHDADFCPQCQPDGRKSSIVDWSKLPGRTPG